MAGGARRYRRHLHSNRSRRSGHHSLASGRGGVGCSAHCSSSSARSSGIKVIRSQEAGRQAAGPAGDTLGAFAGCIASRLPLLSRVWGFLTGCRPAGSHQELHNAPDPLTVCHSSRPRVCGACREAMGSQIAVHLAVEVVGPCPCVPAPSSTLHLAWAPAGEGSGICPAS